MKRFFLCRADLYSFFFLDQLINGSLLQNLKSTAPLYLKSPLPINNCCASATLKCSGKVRESRGKAAELREKVAESRGKVVKSLGKVEK